MNAVKKIIEIDRLSIRPYLTLKNLLIFAVLGLLYVFMSRKPMLVVSMSLMFSLLFASYPFLIGEDSGIDGLYRVLGIPAEEVVLGRYLTAGLITLAATMLGACFVLLSAFAFPVEEVFLTLPIYAAVSLFMSTLMIGIQYPFYFKYGYVKAKTIVLYPFFGIGILSFALIQMREKLKPLILWMSGHAVLLILLFLLVWVGGILVSLKLSKRWYREREF